MRPRSIWQWVLLAVVVYVLIGLLSWILHVVMHLLHIAVVVLIIVGVVYLISRMFDRRTIT